MITFDEYHKANPQIYDLFKRYARQARAAGHRHYSARGIFHRIRWHTSVEAKDPDGFKVNNNYSRDYSLKLVDEDPSFAGFFRMRNSQGLDE